MKHTRIILPVILCIILALTGCAAGDELSHVSRELDLPLPTCQYSEFTDDHGGFHGDGMMAGTITFSMEDGETLSAAIAESGQWLALPLSPEVEMLMYGGELDGVQYGFNFAERAGIPRVVNGCWRFIDRSTGQDDLPLLARMSYNFTFALYDLDLDTLYYCEMDT